MTLQRRLPGIMVALALTVLAGFSFAAWLLTQLFVFAYERLMGR